jgi:hypothetical protein
MTTIEITSDRAARKASNIVAIVANIAAVNFVPYHIVAKVHAYVDVTHKSGAIYRVRRIDGVYCVSRPASFLSRIEWTSPEWQACVRIAKIFI